MERQLLDPATITHKLKNYLAQQPEIVLAYLYGSFATGRVWAESDLDIGVLFDDSLSSHEQFHRALYHAAELSSLLHLGIEIDLRELNGTPAEFRIQVIRPQKCLYARSKREQVQFEVSTLTEYLDFKPVLDQYYSCLLRQIKKGDMLYGYNLRNRVTALGQAARAARGAGTVSADKLA